MTKMSEFVHEHQNDLLITEQTSFVSLLEEVKLPLHNILRCLNNQCHVNFLYIKVGVNQGVEPTL